MSAHKRRLIIQPTARVDLNGVRLYTQQTWGAEQRQRYGVHLRQAIRSLLDHPERGESRDDIYVGCRRLLVGRHIVFYRVEDAEIVIGHVLHQNQDPSTKVRP